MRSDWQQTETPPLALETIRQRLRWRWLMVGLDGLSLLAVTALIVWSSTWISGPLEWIYWSFFVVVLIVGTIATVRWRWRALWRPDDSVTAVLEHARRDAQLRIQAGRLAIGLSVAVGLFVAAWIATAAWLAPMPFADFLGQRLASLAFAAVWCLLGGVAGGWISERGHRQALEVDRLEHDLRQ
jgi:uncharacterized membrane protein (DUF485 family)